MQNNEKHIKIEVLDSFKVISLQSDILTVSTERALPPGSRVSVDFGLNAQGQKEIIEGKVASVAKAGNLFVIKIKTHTVTRKQMLFLKSLPAPLSDSSI